MQEGGALGRQDFDGRGGGFEGVGLQQRRNLNIEFISLVFLYLVIKSMQSYNMCQTSDLRVYPGNTALFARMCGGMFTYFNALYRL